MEFESVIGLEVHAQLKTKTKIFCGCSTAFGAPPNTQVCPVCLGMPGVLPVLNRKVVDYALKMAFATHCTVAGESQWARKNYFYPDLPKGYQISQFALPIAEHGHIVVQLENGAKRVGITRIHMEEDAGKLNHDSGGPFSMVDLNRTGVPLIEIVSEPDMRSPEEAGAYLRQIHALVRYLEICDGNMEEGSFRCDANISIRPQGQEEFGTRTEIKNLNSFKHVEKAIYYEIYRHREIIEDGGKVVQETRLWDPDRNQTFSMRGKEEAHDYRYFPEPDLLPLVIDNPWMEAIQATLPELPEAKKARFEKQYELPAYDAQLLTTSRDLANYFETAASLCPDPKLASNWIMTALLGVLNTTGKTIDQSPVSAKDLAELVCLIKDNTISGKIAKTVFEAMVETGKNPKTIVEEKGLVQVTDLSAISAVIDAVVAENPGQAAEYKSGKTKLMGFFVGQVMKKTKGQANPNLVNEALRKKLEG
ncbi:MAG: Asp-tRNA(Asn)/Glu-tRNA(Gln) amidotransferase subunit GatB [Proteobacteria bacterium]|nr:Asp-tRNA(Asn)/Glu-tRNA(Gln) amidotransferase subunit GatB [Pseudomonadota bacterium]MBU4472023.1 Asp-tRNA(Asn)/Glu-tRNA(Gln) amidotransferase subunit GatB [Pseudomonadota bacterium]MCG2752977.1 Asp-tRNA(Asn)/Glu-tRNA(Gln) amidotransferase subunit GatB [Desulfobacteraceae bacterium]